MNPWVWARDSIKRRGFVQTSKIAGSAACDLLFDLRYGTDTMRWVEVDSLDTNSENKARAVHYQATKARPFLALLGKLKLPRDCTFVDFGSGKGRALLIAAHYGFKGVVGVEFSNQLCALARKNVERFVSLGSVRSKVEVVEADVANYKVRPEECVFYLYNPFDAVVLMRVLDNIRLSLQETPRPIWLIYNTPKHHEIISQSGLFQGCSAHEVAGSDFKVYHG